jgi:hypothetical protein
VRFNPFRSLRSKFEEIINASSKVVINRNVELLVGLRMKVLARVEYGHGIVWSKAVLPE